VVIQLSREEMHRLLDHGTEIVCLVTKNDDFGLRLTAIDFVFDSGNAAVIDIPTASAPKGLKIGDAVLYKERRTGYALITPISPSDGAAQQELRSARKEFLPAMFAH